jgi:hypothetical protein
MERWDSICRSEIPLRLLEPKHGDEVRAVVNFIRTIPRQTNDFITVVVPEQLRSRSLIAAVRRSQAFRLKLRLLGEPQVVVSDVPVVVEQPELDGEPRTVRPMIPRRTEALVFVSSVNKASMRAITYARSLRTTVARAVYFAVDPEEATQIQEEWQRYGVPMQLDIVEAPFRELDAPLLEEIHAVTDSPDALAVVVVAEFRVKKWRHQLLHNQRALFIKRLLLFEPRVILTSVPYRLD